MSHVVFLRDVQGCVVLEVASCRVMHRPEVAALFLASEPATGMSVRPIAISLSPPIPPCGPTPRRRRAFLFPLLSISLSLFFFLSSVSPLPSFLSPFFLSFLGHLLEVGCVSTHLSPEQPVWWIHFNLILFYS